MKKLLQPPADAAIIIAETFYIIFKYNSIILLFKTWILLYRSQN